MARKSRKIDRPQNQDQNISDGIFRVAKYVRLSVEDNGKIDGDSLENQIALLDNYLVEHPDFVAQDLYVDNGSTGTNFERPEFERMMCDIRAGKINCILTKDLSRFGRNYVETGDLLENILPFLGVRFIAINDSVDTALEGCTERTLIALKNMINEFYAKDISRKVCSTLKRKRLSGEFIGNYAPYGYWKDPADKNHLVIDPDTAPIVHQIFEWRAAEIGINAIRCRLNDADIPSPGRYRFEHGIITNNNKKGPNLLWSLHAVKTILENEAYIGNLVQGKVVASFYLGDKLHTVSPEEWDRAIGTHEPIIEKELFDKVQEVARKTRERYFRNADKYTHLEKAKSVFGKKLICASCGRVIRPYRNIAKGGHKAWFTYICPGKNLKECTRSSIRKDDLEEAVLLVIKKQMTLFLQKEKMIMRLLELYGNDDHRNLIAAQEKELSQSIQRNTLLLTELYTDMKDGLLSESEYQFAIEKYRGIISEKKLQLEELQNRNQKLRAVQDKTMKWDKLIERYYMQDELTTELVDAFIEKIELNLDGSLSVEFKFADEFETLGLLRKSFNTDVA